MHSQSGFAIPASWAFVSLSHHVRGVTPKVAILPIILTEGLVDSCRLLLGWLACFIGGTGPVLRLVSRSVLLLSVGQDGVVSFSHGGLLITLGTGQMLKSADPLVRLADILLAGYGDSRAASIFFICWSCCDEQIRCLVFSWTPCIYVYNTSINIIHADAFSALRHACHIVQSSCYRFNISQLQNYALTVH